MVLRVSTWQQVLNACLVPSSEHTSPTDFVWPPVQEDDDSAEQQSVSALPFSKQADRSQVWEAWKAVYAAVPMQA